MKLGIQRVMLSSLIHKHWLDTEMRVSINNAKVEQYADEMRQGDKFPPPLVLIDPRSEVLRVADGFHRILAVKDLGETGLFCDVQRGNMLDAILECIKCNREQKGLPFSRGDKRKCVETLLRNPVSGAWTLLRIAETVGCAGGYVSEIRKQIDVKLPDIRVRSDGSTINQKLIIGKRSNELEAAERRGQVKDLLLKGKTRAEIMEEMDISRGTLHRYIRDLEQGNLVVRCPHCYGSGFVKPSKAERA